MTRQVVAFSLAAATLLIAGTSSAQRPVPTSHAIQLGLHLGYGVPFGKTGRTASDLTDDDVSASIKGQIPIGLDVGYLATPNFYIGVTLQYGFGLVGSAGNGLCDQSGVTCSTSDTSLGVGAQYHLSPTASFDPWIGLGLAYEWLDLSITAEGPTSSATGSGLQYVILQVGGDISVAQNIAAGPFVSFSAGQYSGVSQQLAGGATGSQDITNKSFHEWLLFGVRGIYNIRL
jgi:outer membrane protein W